jgi:amino-acid N-acetyltransferase
VADRPAVVVRRARTADVKAIRAIVAPMAESRVLIAKEAVTYYEAVQQFRVAEVDGRVVGCGALHAMWEDLAEIRTLAVLPEAKGTGVGSALLETLVDDARPWPCPAGISSAGRRLALRSARRRPA